MSKKILKPTDFGKVELLLCEDLALNEEQIKELDALYDTTCAHIKEGQLIKGHVLEVNEHGVLVDIQYKSNGLIPRYEFSSHELRTFKADDEIDVIIAELENPMGEVTLSYEKAKALKAWEKITKLFEEGKPVEGVVSQTVKGGLSVDIGVPAFLPGSQVDIQRVTDFDQYIGQTITADIIKINKKRGNVIISRRKHLADQRANARRKAMETLAEGQVIQGIAKNITNYGVFIDIGGVDGLLHITDMTWGRISHPSEIVKIGDTIPVKILSIDKDNSKISLGMKQLSENPWAALDESVKIGSTIKGKISSITDYGLFVEVQDGIEGLVHISEVSWVDRVENLNDRYKVGNEIEALVVSLDKDNRRMSLSIKQLQDNPWKSAKESIKIGQKVQGPVTNVTDFGVFIQILPGIDGLAHVSDLSWTDHIDHPSSMFKKGDTVDAIVLNVDEDSKKISLGIKQLNEDPFETFAAEHKVGNVVEGTISKLTSIGAFVDLGSIEGLIHSSELTKNGDNYTTKDGADVTVGSKHQLRVSNINKGERKVDLSTNLTAQKKEKTVKREARTTTQKSTTTTSTSNAPKGKSQLQIALEKLQETEK